MNHVAPDNGSASDRYVAEDEPLVVETKSDGSVMIFCAHAEQNGEGAHWKLEGEPCWLLCVEGVDPEQCDHSSSGRRCDVCGVKR